MIRELKTWYHRLEILLASLLTFSTSRIDIVAAYLTNQQPLPLCPLKQKTRFVLAPFNNPHTLLSLRNVVSNDKGFDAFLRAGFIGVDEDVAASAGDQRVYLCNQINIQYLYSTYTSLCHLRTC